MPIYEYGCGKCGVVEVTQRISDPPLQKCPNCKRKVQRLISSTSFQLKGSGWYVTDYARGGKKGSESSSGEGKTSGESKKSDASSASTSAPDTKSPTTSGGTTQSTSS